MVAPRARRFHNGNVCDLPRVSESYLRSLCSARGAAVLIQIKAHNCFGHSLKLSTEIWRGLLCAFFSYRRSPWSLLLLVRCSSSIKWCSVTLIRPSAHRRASAFPTTGIPITWSGAIGIRRKSMDGATRSRLPIRRSRIRHLWPRDSSGADDCIQDVHTPLDEIKRMEGR